jgi:succinate dehydrogenase/fumarate reductase cytochrome b subunit
MKDNVFAKLRRFNMIMGGLHLIQGIAMLFLATTVIQTIAEFSPTITQNFLTFNQQTQSLEVTSEALFELPFGILVASFLLISALAHAIISIPKKTNDIYTADLKKGINRFRWFEYAISSSIMIVLISTLFGIYDIASLILIFVVNAAMNLFGLDMEIINAGSKKEGKINWGPFVWGTIAGLAP